jgi:hypothetical protein
MVRKNLIAAPLWAERYQNNSVFFYDDDDDRENPNSALSSFFGTYACLTLF